MVCFKIEVGRFHACLLALLCYLVGWLLGCINDWFYSHTPNGRVGGYIYVYTYIYIYLYIYIYIYMYMYMYMYIYMYI